ncbi:signal recognition particle-docking protein FtsY [Pseudodesulfovibrio mercurii]|uniref:Signal recognition particle-docking protein FtsY n=1 Tax=Pseudodesulfovibrio mercurii TaxID=641491 RepID=F0JHR2_9BACT|nr:hypothetical protein [Pseudodesulfovibrio mercurii]EGB15298.1 signal recognition particle-docking protein FtsY [Pseudodesulfovibrio mercurii]
MCAAVPVALLLLVVLAALTVLRLFKPAPNARLLAGLLDALGRTPGHPDTPPPAPTSATSSGPVRTDGIKTA